MDVKRELMTVDNLVGRKVCCWVECWAAVMVERLVECWVDL